MQLPSEEKFIFQSKPKAKHWSLVGKIIFILFVLSTVLFVYVFRQDIKDRYTVSIFKPNADIESISKDTIMTDSGKFYFYASQPEINSSDSFNGNCQRKEANSPILGCYVNKRIYIYDVKNDPRLLGVKSITAAHEMLHAAWDRLNDGQKQKLGNLLSNAYQRVKTEELVKRMEYYEREQPGDRIEELHSILGTEFNNLGSELDEYYSRYFGNRNSLIDIYNKYNKIFVDLNKSQELLLDEINKLGNSLKIRIDKYNTYVDKLNSDVSDLESRRDKVDLSNWSQVQEFNSKRDQILARIKTLNTELESIQKLQDEYKSLIDEYNKNVLVGNGLTNSLDSTLKSPASVQQ